MLMSKAPRRSRVANDDISNKLDMYIANNHTNNEKMGAINVVRVKRVFIENDINYHKLMISINY